MKGKRVERGKGERQTECKVDSLEQLFAIKKVC